MEYYDAVPGPVMPYESGKTDETSITDDPRFAAYPVPARDMLTLLSGLEGLTYYKIVTLEGRMASSGSFTFQYDFNTADLSSGSYYLEMSDEKGMPHYRKLIAKH